MLKNVTLHSLPTKHALIRKILTPANNKHFNDDNKAISSYCWQKQQQRGSCKVDSGSSDQWQEFGLHLIHLRSGCLMPD